MSDERKTNNCAELSDEQLEQAAGGIGKPAGKTTTKCPECDSTEDAVLKDGIYVCPNCGHCYGSTQPSQGIV